MPTKLLCDPGGNRTRNLRPRRDDPKIGPVGGGLLYPLSYRAKDGLELFVFCP